MYYKYPLPKYTCIIKHYTSILPRSKRVCIYPARDFQSAFKDLIKDKLNNNITLIPILLYNIIESNNL